MTEDENDRRQVLNRRNILLGSTTLAAATAIGASAQINVTKAQAQSRQRVESPTSCSSWATISAGTTSAPTTWELWATARPTSTASARRARSSPTYGQQSCTAGRAAFITGQSPIRTGLTKVGLPGAELGLGRDPSVAML